METTVLHGEAHMLMARRCPHTGVVNVFVHTQPFLAIGSLVRADAKTYHWRCYLGAPACGAAPDIETAERRLIGRYRQLLREAVAARRRRDANARRTSRTSEATWLASRGN
jgi:hypothetical protein